MPCKDPASGPRRRCHTQPLLAARNSPPRSLAREKAHPQENRRKSPENAPCPRRRGDVPVARRGRHHPPVPAHGHAVAVLGTLRSLGLVRVLGRRRDLAVAAVVARILDPASNPATAKALDPETTSTDLGTLLGLGPVTGNGMLDMLDWLLERQPWTGRSLANRHLKGGNTLILHHVGSSCLEGGKCPLAAFGYNRDGKGGRMHRSPTGCSAPRTYQCLILVSYLLIACHEPKQANPPSVCRSSIEIHPPCHDSRLTGTSCRLTAHLARNAVCSAWNFHVYENREFSSPDDNPGRPENSHGNTKIQV